MKFTWVSDPHLNHMAHTLSAIDYIVENTNETLLVGGDMYSAVNLLGVFTTLLDELKAKKKQAYAVLGNHDFYGGSIQEVRNNLKGFKNSIFEPSLRRTPVFLGDLAIVGTGGVGDATRGCQDPSKLRLNDEVYIKELTIAEENGQLKSELLRLSNEHALYLTSLLNQTSSQSKIIILTHVAPWPEASWHEGKIGDAAGLARFCWGLGGEVIDSYSTAYPEKEIVVLCGHGHSAGIYRNSNYTCHTAGAQYMVKHINAQITVDDKINVARLDKPVS